ncbi:alpha-tocopherol transfer protein-like [Rhynchophorus ferrugineus]|uniref:alpha-tocopherol transfer protein-like n=1 Tax=Rhynchophorus ferrugineus TaxID=354439 RepID=UPI003FCD4BDB
MAVSLFGNHTSEVYKQMYKDYNKTEEDLDQYVDIMRQWAESQPHFPEVPSKKVLKFVILYNKFSIEKAKQKLDMYYTIRSLMPEIYDHHPLSPDMILHGKITYCVPLPKLTSDCKRILFAQLNPNYGPDVFDHEKLLVHVHHVLELLIQEDDTYNFHLIFDCGSIKAAHLPKFSPMVVRKASIIIEKVYSNRMASIYLVNFHSFMEAVFNTILIPALNKKIRDRVKISANTDILFDVFGKDVLPKDVGGNELSLEELNNLLLKKFEENKESYERVSKLRVNESLRPDKLVNDDLLGYYGNFRKINVD